MVHMLKDAMKRDVIFMPIMAHGWVMDRGTPLDLRMSMVKLANASDGAFRDDAVSYLAARGTPRDVELDVPISRNEASLSKQTQE